MCKYSILLVAICFWGVFFFYFLERGELVDRFVIYWLDQIRLISRWCNVTWSTCFPLWTVKCLFLEFRDSFTKRDFEFEKLRKYSLIPFLSLFIHFFFFFFWEAFIHIFSFGFWTFVGPICGSHHASNWS